MTNLGMSAVLKSYLFVNPGPVFMKGLRLSLVLGLNVGLKLRLLSKFCLKSVFIKGVLAKSKIIKKPQWFSVSCDLSVLFKLYYWRYISFI